MKQSDLNEILTKHKRWLSGKEGGEPADLRGANLRDADLRDVDLQRADLQGTDLRWADLQGANLDYSCFRFGAGARASSLTADCFYS